MYFCPKCGVRTRKGVEDKAPLPYEDMREIFAEMGKEIERAFSIAAKEMDKAFQTARNEIRKATSKEPKICLSCGEKNSPDSRFCHKCGQKL